MKRLVLVVVMILAMACPALAGDKEDIQKDLQINRLALQNMELQMMLLQKDYPGVQAKLKDLEEKLKAIEAKEPKVQKPESPK